MQLPSPIVKSNGILAMAHQAKVVKAMKYLEEISTEQQDCHPFYAATANLYIELGQIDEAQRY